MPESTIGEEIAAEIQISIDEDVAQLESQTKRLSALVDELGTLGLHGDISATDRQISVGVLTSDRSSRPAFSGLLYGASAVRITMEIRDQTILSVDSEARTDIDTCDFGDGYRRVKWTERQLLAELTDDAVNDGGYDLLIIDAPLTIPRQETLTYDESPAKVHWDEMLADLDCFWTEIHEKVQPWTTDGPFVVGMSHTRSNLLFTALRDGEPDAFVHSPPEELFNLVGTNWETLTDLGPNRVLDELLTKNTYTIAYPFAESRLDRRWLPSKLRGLGVQGIFFRHQSDHELQHLELPGNTYTVRDIEKLCNLVAGLCWLTDVPVPVPLWYARKECSFPNEMLDLYYKKLAEQH